MGHRPQFPYYRSTGTRLSSISPARLLKGRIIFHSNSSWVVPLTTRYVHHFQILFHMLTSFALPLQLLNLGLKDRYKDGIKELGFSLEDILEQERDAALGNGGLGRLAACYLDSSASQVCRHLNMLTCSGLTYSLNKRNSLFGVMVCDTSTESSSSSFPQKEIN